LLGDAIWSIFPRVGALLSVPGPRPIPFLGAKAGLIRFGLDPLAHIERLFDKYGPVVALVRNRGTRIVSTQSSPGTVFFYGPDLNLPFLTEHEQFHKCALSGPLYPDPPFTERKQPLTRLLTGLFHVNGQEHRKHRRLLLPAFHKSRIESYRDSMVQLTQEVLQRLSPGVRDLRQDLVELSLRIATTTLFGEDVGVAGRRIARDWQRWLELFRMAAAVPLDLPGMPYRDFLELSRSIDEKSAELIATRRRTGARGADMLSMLLDTTDESGNTLSDDELIGHASVIFAAGHETSAGALSWTLLLLSQHPKVAAELVEELQQVLQGEPPRVDQLSKLPLLDRVVKESLRILPPVPFNHRICPEDCELGGYALPRGTELLSSIYRTQRMPDLYPEPNRFKPERWEKLEPGPYSYNPFGTGPRMCIGATFALMEIKIVLAMLLQAYRFELVPGSRIHRFLSITMSPRPGLPMRLHRQDNRFERSARDIRGNVRDMVDFT